MKRHNLKERLERLEGSLHKFLKNDFSSERMTSYSPSKSTLSPLKSDNSYNKKGSKTPYSTKTFSKEAEIGKEQLAFTNKKPDLSEQRQYSLSSVKHNKTDVAASIRDNLQNRIKTLNENLEK